jgi:hypothetical protein
MPVKDSHTRTANFDQQPRPLHSRYTRTVAFARWGMAVTLKRYNFLAIPLPKWPHYGRFASETAT